MATKLDLAAIRNRLTTLQSQTKKNDSLWKPPAGKSVIRLIPYKFRPENPFIELLFHYGFAGKTYLSPASFGRPDPIVDYAEKLRATGDKENYKMARTLDPKLRTFAPIIVRGEEDKGAKFWGFGKQVYQEILAIINDPEYGDITDPSEGFDLTIEYKTAEETGKNFPSTIIRPKRQPSPIVETREALQKIVDSQKEITEMYKELTFAELVTVLEKWSAGDQSTTTVAADDDSAEEAPAPVKKAAAPVAKSTISATKLGDVNKAFDDLFTTK